MKNVLTFFCVVAILFSGGCAVMLGGIDMNMMSGFGLPLIAIAALNIAVLAALYGWANVPAWPLYILAALDFLIALFAGFTLLTTAGSLGVSSIYGLVPVGVAALKGYLTVQVAKGMNSPQ